MYFIGHNTIVHVYNKKITVKAVICSDDGLVTKWYFTIAWNALWLESIYVHFG